MIWHCVLHHNHLVSFLLINWKCCLVWLWFSGFISFHTTMILSHKHWSLEVDVYVVPVTDVTRTSDVIRCVSCCHWLIWCTRLFIRKCSVVINATSHLLFPTVSSMICTPSQLHCTTASASGSLVCHMHDIGHSLHYEFDDCARHFTHSIELIVVLFRKRDVGTCCASHVDRHCGFNAGIIVHETCIVNDFVDVNQKPTHSFCRAWTSSSAVTLIDGIVMWWDIPASNSHRHNLASD